MNVYFTSEKGLRKTNEDAHNILIENNVEYYAIYDGHGGDFTSSILSKFIHRFFMKEYVINKLTDKYINAVFRTMQKILKTHFENGATHTGSTCLMAMKATNNNSFTVVNLGDSRCIICRNNLAMQITKDHKPNWPEERHRIECLGGKIINDDSDWRIMRLSVSRSFGDIYANPYVSYMPDIFRFNVSRDDKFMVMGCDGLWDALSNNDVVNFVLEKCYDFSLQNRINHDLNIAEMLAKEAMHNGSTDNITVIVVFFH